MRTAGFDVLMQTLRAAGPPRRHGNRSLESPRKRPAEALLL
jgi:hypothetical protein